MAAAEFPIPQTKNERWMSLSSEQLLRTTSSPEEKNKLDKFLNLGIPVLRKIKSGFVADDGDIQVCLLIHHTDEGLKVEVCHINDEGELFARLVEHGQQATRLLQTFTLDFPAAVWTTSQRKPLCFFTQMKEQKQLSEKMLDSTCYAGPSCSMQDSNCFAGTSKSQDSCRPSERSSSHDTRLAQEENNTSFNVLGQFSNYVSYAEFKNIMKLSDKIEKISVMVPS
jgi:hypothetical protein